MFKKLQLRLTIVCAASTGLVLIGMAVASCYSAIQQMERQWEESFQSDLQGIFFYLRGQNAIDHSYLAQTEATGNMYIRIESKGRPLFFTYLNAERAHLTEEVGVIAREQYRLDFRRAPSGTLQADMVVFEYTAPKNTARYRAAVASVPVGSGNWMGVVALKDRSSEFGQIGRLCMIYALFVAIALLCLAVFAWFFSGRTVRPVADGYRRQAEFIAAASHEMRSPLAVIQASVDAVRSAPPGTAAHFVDKIDTESVRLAGLAGDLLDLMTADSGRLTYKSIEVDPATLMLSVAERFEGLAAQKNIWVDTRLPEEDLPIFRCDAGRVDQLLGILLDNAMSYTPEGGVIRLSVDFTRRAMRFHVADSGPGIPPDERDKVFERFYRVDASRTQKDHYGLGLSIARELVALHKGNITVQDAPEGGAEFVVTLPR